METFNTNKGKLTASELLESLEYTAYAANRDYGMTHEQLVKIGVGNEEMRIRYENETK